MSKCSAKNRRCAGGDEWCIGGTLRIEDGATLDVAEGAEIKGLSTGGGASTWDDLGKKVETIFDETLTFAPAEDFQDLYSSEVIQPLAVSAGDTVVVEWDGEQYKCEVVDWGGAPIIGNESAVGGTNSDEPFHYTVLDGRYFFIALDTATTHTIKVYKELITPLPVEYQPPLFFHVDDLVLYKDAEFTEGVTIADVNDVLTGYILQGGNAHKVIRVDSTMPAGFHAYILDSNGSLIPYESTDFVGGVV